MSQEPKRGHFAKAKGEIILREHEFDGIQEYDQKLPNWWLFTFYGAIVWFVVHWVLYYHTSVFQDAHQEVKDKIVAVQQTKAAEVEKMVASLNDSKFVHEWAANPERVTVGEATFLTHCTPCHGVDLSATITTATGKTPLPGLPLNDHQWKFGATDKDGKVVLTPDGKVAASPMRIFKLINEGSPPESTGNNGAKMQVWGQQLTPKQIAEVVSYIISKVPDDFKDIPPP
jgi:cytochrome c oxidase cbb3-type subunit III